MIISDIIEKYIDHTINSGEEQIRNEFKWILENLDNPEEIKQGVNDVVDGLTENS
jgi:hypothetical protein